MDRLVLKPNPLTHTLAHCGPCCSCGQDAKPAGHWDIFRGDLLVCRACAAKEESALVAAHRLAVVIESAWLTLHSDRRDALVGQLEAALDEAEREVREAEAKLRQASPSTHKF
jgi:hypothetical protein